MLTSTLIFFQDIDKRALGEQVKINSELDPSGHLFAGGIIFSQVKKIECECFSMKVKDRSFGATFCSNSAKAVSCSLEYRRASRMYINECREKLRKIAIVLISDETTLCIHHKSLIRTECSL